MGLLLQAVDVAGPWRWRWLLSDEETGNPVADHPVRLDPESAELARFRDLYGYVRAFAAPDRRVTDGARFVAAAGAWAGQQLLGDAVAAAIQAAAPVTVRVTVPADLDPVLLWPLELAHVNGRPLAALGDVTLVYDIEPNAPVLRKDAAHGALRMLAVFSQPTSTDVLALRRERYALARLIRNIAARQQATVELHVVQYGVTRERLGAIADSGDGWDVLHLSAHGAGGALFLEKADGSPDLVSTANLIALLRPARRRLKLAVVSVCESAADATAETYRLLGLVEQAEALETESASTVTDDIRVDAGTDGPPATAIPGLARALVRELGCAVIGMRYPVTDEFAIAFTDVLYDQLLSRRQPVDIAAARAVAEAAGPVASTSRPAVSLATPGVFGAQANGLRLSVPRGRPLIDPTVQRMAYFPDEPLRFVGRAAAMARASQALAPDSGLTTVLLHGMAGAGKTACALELAYRHQDSFAAAAFWQAPTRADEWASALPDFANRLEIQLGDYGFNLAGNIATTQAVLAFAPRLRQLMRNGGLLLVLDNLETLLTPYGTWRDSRWGPLMTALSGHDGESRVILTSRTVPAALFDGTSGSADVGSALAERIVTLPVHALSLGESVALARELPNLRALMHTDAGPIRVAAGTYAYADADGAAAEVDRVRVRRVLQMVQGHPKLMELADAAAANRDRLDAQLAAAESAGAGQELEAFFRDGTSALDPGQFLNALTDWTIGALAALPPEARLMGEFIARLEDGDRMSYVVEANWADLWRRLGSTGDPPAPGPLVNALADAALVDVEGVPAPSAVGQTASGDLASTGNDPTPAAYYQVHPGVGAAMMAAAGPEVLDAADAELAAYWEAVSDWAWEREGREDSGLLVRAGLAAAPYLLRRGDWDAAGRLLENAVSRDGSPRVVQAALPWLRRVAAATGTHQDADVLARALQRVDPGGAEQMLRGALADAAEARDYRAASAIVGDLVNLLRDGGRLAEALVETGQLMDYTRRAQLGPWTQLAGQAQRLQVLGMMGEHAQVLAETGELRTAMADLPFNPAANESVVSWSVRETILDAANSSAVAVADWATAIDLNSESIESRRSRGAGSHEIMSAYLNDAAPLIRLGRLAEAGLLLAECQRVFEDHADSRMLGHVLSLRADLEGQLNHYQAAGDLAKAALRLAYVRPAGHDRTGALQPRHLSPGDTERRSRRALSPTRGGPGLPDNRHGLRDGQCAARDRPDAT